MVTVIVVLEHDFPVELIAGPALRSRSLRLRDIPVRDSRTDLGQPWSQRRCYGIEIDEDKPEPDLDPELRQADPALVEADGFVHGRRADQPPVECIGPVVIRTGEAVGITTAFRDEHRTVLTDRGHGSELAVARAYDDHGLADDRCCEVVSGV